MRNNQWPSYDFKLVLLSLLEVSILMGSMFHHCPPKALPPGDCHCQGDNGVSWQISQPAVRHRKWPPTEEGAVQHFQVRKKGSCTPSKISKGELVVTLCLKVPQRLNDSRFDIILLLVLHDFAWARLVSIHIKVAIQVFAQSELVEFPILHGKIIGCPCNVSWLKPTI